MQGVTLLYFVSPRERPWRQRVFRRKTLVIKRATFSHMIKKGTPGLMHKGCVLQRVSLDALSDVTVVIGMRQSIGGILSEDFMQNSPIAPTSMLIFAIEYSQFLCRFTPTAAITFPTALWWCTRITTTRCIWLWCLLVTPSFWCHQPCGKLCCTESRWTCGTCIKLSLKTDNKKC